MTDAAIDKSLARAGGILFIIGLLEIMAVGLVTNLPHAQPVAPSRNVGFWIFLALAVSQLIAGLFLLFGRRQVWPAALVLAACVSIGIASFDAHGFWPVSVSFLGAQVLAIALLVAAGAPMPSASGLVLWSAPALVPIAFGMVVLFTTPPPSSRVPDTVGVISSVKHTNGATVVTLESGATVEVNLSGERLYPGPSDEGLLLSGIHDGRSWYFILGTYRSDPTCFELEDTATDMDTHILFDSGVLLPKAPGFRRLDRPHEDRYEDLAQIGFTPFCLNDRGEVTDYLTLGSPRR